MRRVALLVPPILGALVLGSCRGMTEKEALEAAREEVRREMQPEIDRRKRQIAELEKQIAEARKRLAERQARENRKEPNPIR